MGNWSRLLQNHVLANLLFVLVLVIGALSYVLLPRQQDPTINFNWIDISTFLPGATASDVEKRVTDPLEDAIRNVADIKFVSSNSREGVSSILVRFNDISDRIFDKRIADLRREIQNAEARLPDQASDPFIFEITSSNAYPSATVIITGPANDESLRRQADIVKKDLERITGVDRILETALPDPELQIRFNPTALQAQGINPIQLADTISAHYRDISAGSLDIGGENWLVRLLGTNSDPGYLARIPVNGVQGEVLLGELADIARGREKANELVRFKGKPAIMLGITKKGDSNVITLVNKITKYIERKNFSLQDSGLELYLADDQTGMTRDALRIMQTNALLGLMLVLLVTWLFLGTRIAFLTCIGIPFTLAGTFWFLSSVGQTLNVSVLLGVVISLGMLVDDAVVVVEAIYYRIQRGMQALPATLAALKEVAMPVTTAVLTTVSIFICLMLLPGILGKFMRVIPMVVTAALLISLVEAFWMLPAHIIVSKIDFAKPSRVHHLRVRGLQRIRNVYGLLLTRVLRYPRIALSALFILFIVSVLAVALGKVKYDFFASDPIRLFYVNVTMPNGTPLEQTMATVLDIEAVVQHRVDQHEQRSIVSFAGRLITETAPFFGNHYGQVMVSLKPQHRGMRHVDAVIDGLRDEVQQIAGPSRVTILRIAGGPPTSKPVNVKVRGDDLATVRSATEVIKGLLANHAAFFDITDDAPTGQYELALRINLDAANRAGINPLTISRTLRLLIDGEVVARMQDQGEELELRLKSSRQDYSAIDELLGNTLTTAQGDDIPLRELVYTDRSRGPANIRHYNFRRAIGIEADINKDQIDTLQANDFVREQWQHHQSDYPNIDLDFTGQLDDLQESLDALWILLLLGVGLVYMILGAQFNSYFQPMMILTTLLMAFIGIVMGLMISGNPLSLFSMYGVVALAGISVNAAIVLISAANDRLAQGMTVLHATVYAARRRVIPILITSLTTIAGLFSLATGLGGHSLLWGPVATVIVWGLMFSTLLTLFVIPVLYRLSMNRSHRVQHESTDTV